MADPYVGLHSTQRNNHRLETFVFSSAAARAAGTGYAITADDLAKIAYQQDRKSYWRLNAIGPPLVWVPIGGEGACTGTIGCAFGGTAGGAPVLTAGLDGYYRVPFAGTIVRATLLAKPSTNMVLDVWRDTYAAYPPTDADSITAAAPPTLASAVKYEDATLTAWTTGFSAGDVFGFNVDSCSAATWAVLILDVIKG